MGTAGNLEILYRYLADVLFIYIYRRTCQIRLTSFRNRKTAECSLEGKIKLMGIIRIGNLDYTDKTMIIRAICLVLISAERQEFLINSVISDLDLAVDFQDRVCRIQLYLQKLL